VAPVNLPDRVVLIVEDAESCATTLEIALLAIPHIHVRVAPTARQALEILAIAGAGICALVTDLHLPLMDGFELIERLRSDSRTARLPIVVISGDQRPQNTGAALPFGSQRLLRQTLFARQVRQKVEQLLDANTTSQFP